MKNQPKPTKRDQTRAKLLEAAAQLVREKGFEKARLQDIAERAGMTVGAIYGNFKNRDEVFLALSDVFWPPVKPNLQSRANLTEILDALADATIRVSEERRVAATTRLAGISYTLANEDIREIVHDKTSEDYDLATEWLKRTCTEKLPMEPEMMVRIIHCLIDGLLFQRFLTPDLITDEVIHSAFISLAP